MNVKFIPNTLGVLLLTAFMIFVSALLYALPLWLVWNWTIPGLFKGAPSLTLIDAFLLNILTGILFRSKEK